MIGVPLALAVGVLIVRLNWLIGKRLWLRSQRYSVKATNRIALLQFALDITWIVVATIAGFGLGSLLIKLV